MSRITKWAFQNKAALLLMSVFTLFMGIFSYVTLPMEFLPPVDQPQISVVVMGQGTDAATMEKQVTVPIETAAATVPRKRNVYATTGDGFTKVDVFFEPKTDMTEAKRHVQEALENVVLPPTVMKPNIVQLNTSMIPIADVSVTFEDGLTPANMEFAKKELVPYFKDIAGVAGIQTLGTVDSYVSIELKTDELGKRQIPLQNVLTLLQGQNITAAIAEKTIDGKASNITVSGNVKSIEDLQKLTVAPKTALTDIAAVTVKKPENTMTRVNGKDGLFLIVTKDSHSNAVSVNKDVRKAVQSINDKYKNVQAEVVFATADMVENSVNSMMKEVLLGALFATIVIMFFLRNIRSTFITVVSIPLSLCFTLFLLSKSGVTLNILTLGGIAVAVGRLVDDSIVVIENIFRRLQKEAFSIALLIEATKEVGSAITSSTLTTVAVFLPIGLVSGDLQNFLLPFALTLTYSLLASLIIALTIVPVMSAGLLKNTKLPVHKPAVRFPKLLNWSLQHKWVVLLLSALLFIGSIGAYFTMPKGAVSDTTADFLQVSLQYPNDTPIATVAENTKKLESFALKQTGVKYVYTQLGNSADNARYGEINSPTKANLMLILDKDVDAEPLIQAFEKQKSAYQGAELTAGIGSMMGGSSTQITIDVIGDKLADLEQTAAAIKQQVADIDGIEKVTTNQEEKKSVYSFIVDPAAAKADQVAQQLAVMLNTTPIGSLTVNNHQTPVMIEPLLHPKTEADLKNIMLALPSGPVPAASIAKLQREEKAVNLFHKDGDPYLRVTVNVDPEKLSVVAAKLQTAVFGEQGSKGITLPDGVSVFIGGASTQQASDFTDLFMTMLASIGIVFLIMVITFKSIRAPIAILCSLPLAAIGAILGLLISRIAVGVTSLLGALLLIGIVVTNAIVLLDRVKHNEQTMTMREALIEAASTRMRPIFMTAVATICAMLPLLFKKAESGSLVSANLAVVVIGGLSVATMLTLIVIPVVYELLHFRKAKKQRLQQQQEASL